MIVRRIIIVDISLFKIDCYFLNNQILQMNKQLLRDKCIICIEEDNCILVKKNQHCDCEYSVHKKCLNKWIKQQNKCVICRKLYNEDDNLSLFECCVLIVVSFGLYTLFYVIMFCLTFGTLFSLFYICVKLIHLFTF